MTLIVRNDEAERLLSVRAAIPVVEDAIGALGAEHALSSPRYNLATPVGSNREGVIKLWAAVLPDAGVAAVRITSAVFEVTLWGGYAVGEPVAAAPGQRYTGLILVLSSQTSEPLGIVHDGYISQLGISIPVGIAASHLARPNASIIGVLGTGTQARQQLEAVTAARNCADVRVYAPRKKDAELFAGEVADTLNLPVAACSDQRQAVDGCDVVIAATSALGPVVDAEWVRPGTHISFTRPWEVPDALLARASRTFGVGPAPTVTLSMGTAGALWHAREVKATGISRRIESLAALVSGLAPGRRSPEEVTVFAPFTGQSPGVLWPALGKEILDRAAIAGVGQTISLEWLLQGRPS